MSDEHQRAAPPRAFARCGRDCEAKRAPRDPQPALWPCTGCCGRVAGDSSEKCERRPATRMSRPPGAGGGPLIAAPLSTTSIRQDCIAPGSASEAETGICCSVSIRSLPTLGVNGWRRHSPDLDDLARERSLSTSAPVPARPSLARAARLRSLTPGVAILPPDYNPMNQFWWTFSITIECGR